MEHVKPNVWTLIKNTRFQNTSTQIYVVLGNMQSNLKNSRNHYPKQLLKKIFHPKFLM